MKHLINTIETYRVDTVEEVEKLHEEMRNDPCFALASFSYKTKYLKSKGNIIDEWQLVTAKKVFNDEKDPEVNYNVTYSIGGSF